MVSAIIGAVLKLVLFVVRWFFNILLLPLTTFINGMFPDLTAFITDADYFINEYVFKAIACGREIFLNLTGFPHGLIVVSVNLAEFFLVNVLVLKMVTFIINLWRNFKGGKSV